MQTEEDQTFYLPGARGNRLQLVSIRDCFVCGKAKDSKGKGPKRRRRRAQCFKALRHGLWCSNFPGSGFILHTRQSYCIYKLPRQEEAEPDWGQSFRSALGCKFCLSHTRDAQPTPEEAAKNLEIFHFTLKVKKVQNNHNQ